MAGFGATLPVRAIDGVGPEYSDDFAGAAIETLQDLVKCDPLQSLGRVPLVKLREFRAKARMVLQVRISIGSLTPFADRTISNFLRERPEDLAPVGQAPDVTPQIIARLQEQVAILQVALDEAELQRISVGDLLKV